MKEEAEHETVQIAREWMKNAHAGQTRKDGLTPYAVHPEAVLKVLRDAGRTDLATAIVALLHDVVEDTTVTLDDVREQFGAAIADAVDALSRRPGEPYSAYLARMAKAPQWIRDVKAADVVANLRDLDNAGDPGWASRYAQMKSKFLARVKVSGDLALLVHAEMARLAAAAPPLDQK